MNYPEAEPRGITSLNAMLLNVFRRRASGYFLRINHDTIHLTKQANQIDFCLPPNSLQFFIFTTSTILPVHYYQNLMKSQK